jgi:hypothetical protein
MSVNLDNLLLNKKGLNSLKEKIKKTGGSDFDGESKYLKLKDGESIRIRFLQELFDDAKTYNPKNGIALIFEQHVSPHDFARKALCTMESEGKCWACEQTVLPDVGRRWRARQRLLINVLVRDQNKVKILEQGFGERNIGSILVELSEIFGGITGFDCQLVRKGAGLDTSYRLINLPASDLDVSKFEVYNLYDCVKYVSYADQADYYTTKSETSQWLTS